MNDRDKAELYRAIGEQFLRSPELHQMLATPFVGVAEAVAAWVEQMDRQTLDVVAAFDAQLAEMSRGIASALLDTHMAIISIPVSRFLVRPWIKSPGSRFPTIRN